MARLPRLNLACTPQHILQRGNNRIPVFFLSDDYHLYLEILYEAAEKYNVMVHAYCLMPNHIHLLMTPDDTNGISRVMQDLGRRYVRYINYRHKRTGTLWEGRYHSCLVESNKRLLDCYKYVESNPLRAKLIDKIEEYTWSSFHCNAIGIRNNHLIPHEEYIKLGRTVEQRCQLYKEFFANHLTEKTIKQIREATQSNRVFGSERFIQRLESELAINIHKKKPGRPKKVNRPEEAQISI